MIQRESIRFKVAWIALAVIGVAIIVFGVIVTLWNDRSEEVDMSAITEKSVVQTRIVKIGNSQGIRIPKWLLEQSGLGDEVVLEVQGNQIVIRKAKHPREGWEEQFRAAVAESGDEGLLDPDLTGYSDFDQDEWEW